MKARTRWMGLLVVVIVLFFWKILFTHQFSLLMNNDNANCAYAWDHFISASIKQGVPPLWDPNTHAGRSFIGEMQTAVFYPLKLLLYLWPFDPSGLLPADLLHRFYVFAHLLAALFMFVLAEELGLAGFSAFVAALCFSLGGFVGRVGWPFMLDSAIWLPLIFLFLIRALRSENAGRGVLYACLTGLGLGMAALGGMLHLVMMDALVVISVAAYAGYDQAGPRSERSAGQTSAGALAGRRPAPGAGSGPWRSLWARSAIVLLVAGVVAFAAAAIQLLPSIEYSGLAIRYRGSYAPLPARQKVPYAELIETFQPHSLLSFLLGGNSAGALAFSPYFGVLPLLLAIVGVWRNWDKTWVRYLAGLAVLAFIYTLGPFSFLHGLLYALVPYLWMAFEAGRFIYLAHFAMALLAGFGVETLFAGEGQGSLAAMARVLKWVVIAAVAALTIPALSWKPAMDEWMYFSLLLLIGSYGLFVYVLRDHRAQAARFVLVAMIVCDLYAFNWTIANRQETQKTGKDFLEDLLNTRGVANFLRSQPGLFRAQVQVDDHPNMGDLYAVQTTGGRFATVLKDFADLWVLQPAWEVARLNDLLNVRYVVRPRTASPGPEPLGPAPRAGASDPGPVYQDSFWKVYENATYLPRGWVVGRVEWEPSQEKVWHRLGERGFDPSRVALVSERVGGELGGWEEGAKEEVIFIEYRGDRMTVRVRSLRPGMLVLSEVDYPGWRATVGGRDVKIYKVDGLLRGVMVPSGESQVVLRYAPVSVLAGAVLSALAFLGTLAFALALWMRGPNMSWRTRIEERLRAK